MIKHVFLAFLWGVVIPVLITYWLRPLSGAAIMLVFGAFWGSFVAGVATWIILKKLA